MNQYTKMVMVPQDSLGQQQINLQQQKIDAPLLNQLSSLDSEMQAILSSQSISPVMKMQRYMQALQRYQLLKRQQSMRIPTKQSTLLEELYNLDAPRKKKIIRNLARILKEPNNSQLLEGPSISIDSYQSAPGDAEEEDLDFGIPVGTSSPVGRSLTKEETDLVQDLRLGLHTNSPVGSPQRVEAAGSSKTTPPGERQYYSIGPPPPLKRGKNGAGKSGAPTARNDRNHPPPRPTSTRPSIPPPRLINEMGLQKGHGDLLKY